MIFNKNQVGKGYVSSQEEPVCKSTCQGLRKTGRIPPKKGNKSSNPIFRCYVLPSGKLTWQAGISTIFNRKYIDSFWGPHFPGICYVRWSRSAFPFWTYDPVVGSVIFQFQSCSFFFPRILLRLFHLRPCFHLVMWVTNFQQFWDRCWGPYSRRSQMRAAGSLEDGTLVPTWIWPNYNISPT